MSAQIAQNISPIPPITAVEEFNETNETEEDASENYDATLLGSDNSLDDGTLGDNSSSTSSSGILVQDSPSNEATPLTQSLNTSQVLISLDNDNDNDPGLVNRDNNDDGSFVDAAEEIGNESAENTATENYEATLKRPEQEEQEQESNPVSPYKSDRRDKRSNNKFAIILNTAFDITLAGLFVGWLVSRRPHVGKQSLGIGTVGLTIIYGAQWYTYNRWFKDE
ncbi:8888_t:CDS:2 [Ambispora leptoticha]|uniref:8888_t:CDS:1 n=1 Tax=Ambispora leptoticha TaxID=144679 RepID=A0A9N9CRH1_9GLOM|nr:8888_t:CDS:2 [Ambispora leptoticha]